MEQKNCALPAYTQADIKRHLLENGGSGTVYAYVFPECKQILEHVLDGGNRDRIIDGAIETLPPDTTPQVAAQFIKAALAKSRAAYLDMFEEPWTNRQDEVHERFFAAWKQWSAPIVTLAPEHSNYAYPTAGASEGLREAINMHSIHSRVEGREPVIHVFQGEYEGFPSYAKAAHVTCVMHERDNWEGAIAKIGAHDQVYISQPSAIDGNVWDDFELFTQRLYKKQPTAEIVADITYVGLVAKDFKVDLNQPNIKTIVFSLSKPFGIYYHRIGGLLSREEYPSLFGNKWFKGLQGLQYGTALLMDRFNVHSLSWKYECIRERAVQNIGRKLGLDFRLSDVMILATATPTDRSDHIQSALLRGDADREKIRINLTPEITRLVNGEDAVIVDPRPIPIIAGAYQP
jgi:hypothetical protein